MKMTQRADILLNKHFYLIETGVARLHPATLDQLLMP